jgi:phosphoglycerate dehydrogenase-like enzyme
MKDALAVADHVVLSFPGTAANARMFDASMFGAMKSGAFFYNVGRGIVVDEGALFTALKSRHLGGAAIDVFQQEPLQADHPLWDADNILITPHSAGRSVKEFDRICDLFVRNLQRLEKGEPLLNRIDLSNE